MKTKTKYIFVTGGVISGVGKGIMAASIGAILKAKGLRVSMQKCDPYFSVDAGFLNPNEHGECYVTADGGQTDLDLGHYERFLDVEMTENSIWTSGKLYKTLLDKERAGEFGGKTLQLVPHVTGLAQQTWLDNAEHFKSDVHIIEIGGTVGDMEGLHFIEAARGFASRIGRENVLFVHVCYVPWLGTSQEFKTKPAQNSLRDLREFGIIPDMVVARMDVDRMMQVPDIAKKLSTFCGIREDAVVLMPDAKSVYEVPLNAVKGGVLAPLERFIDHGDPDMAVWEDLMKRIESKPEKTVHVGLIAKYIDNTDTYISVTEALKAAAWKVGVGLKVDWIKSEAVDEQALEKVDAVVVPGGSGEEGLEGEVLAAEYCMEHDKPYLGICLGMQAMAIAAARKAGLKKAGSEEADADLKDKIVLKRDELRLGAIDVELEKGSLTERVYGKVSAAERHRCGVEINKEYLKEIEKGGVKVSGRAKEGDFVDFMEASGRKFMIGAQGHPEFRSRPYRAHPLFEAFLKAI